MSFEVIMPTAEPQSMWVADRRLWLAADQKTVVEDGKPGAAFLLCGQGQSIPRARAESLGLLTMVVEPIELETEPIESASEKERPKPEDKMRAPAEDKSKKTSRKTAKRKKLSARTR